MGKGCLILVDKHTEVLLKVRSLLEPHFDAILMVADQKSLQSLVDQTIPCLIIVDLSVHICREANTARWIRENFPEARFIVLSVHDEPIVVKECLEAGASAFVLKRSVVDDLIPAVEAVLRGETFVSPGVEAEWEVENLKGEGEVK